MHVFCINPRLDSEETDTAFEDECFGAFPDLLDGFFEERFCSLEGGQLASYVQSLWARKKVTSQQIINLEKQKRSQSASKLWYKHREGRITASKKHDIFQI